MDRLSAWKEDKKEVHVMLNPSRNPYQDWFDVQREFDRLFHQFWSDLPERTALAPATSFQVNTTDEGWRIDVPLPGIDPSHVTLESAGNALIIRAEEPGDGKGAARVQFEQTITVPQFLNLDKLSASHRHGMLQLTLPLKDSVKPRRIQIETMDGQRQLAGATK
jgi:HSP20 family protein